MMQRSLAARLRVLRAERGLTQEQAAALAHVTPETLSDLERGRRRAYMPTLAKIAKGYGVPVSALLEEEVSALPKVEELPSETPSETHEEIVQSSVRQLLEPQVGPHLADENFSEKLDAASLGETVKIARELYAEIEWIRPVLSRYLGGAEYRRDPWPLRLRERMVTRSLEVRLAIAEKKGLTFEEEEYVVVEDDEAAAETGVGPEEDIRQKLKVQQQLLATVGTP